MRAYDQPTMRQACQPVAGFGGGDLRYTGMTSVKDCRLSASKRSTIRTKTDARPNAGFVTESQDRPRTHYSKNARRKLERYGRS